MPSPYRAPGVREKVSRPRSPPKAEPDLDDFGAVVSPTHSTTPEPERITEFPLAKSIALGALPFVLMFAISVFLRLFAR